MSNETCPLMLMREMIEKIILESKRWWLQLTFLDPWRWKHRAFFYHDAYALSALVQKKFCALYEIVSRTKLLPQDQLQLTMIENKFTNLLIYWEQRCQRFLNCGVPSFYASMVCRSTWMRWKSMSPSQGLRDRLWGSKGDQDEKAARLRYERSNILDLVISRLPFVI